MALSIKRLALSIYRHDHCFTFTMSSKRSQLAPLLNLTKVMRFSDHLFDIKTSEVPLNSKVLIRRIIDFYTQRKVRFVSIRSITFQRPETFDDQRLLLLYNYNRLYLHSTAYNYILCVVLIVYNVLMLVRTKTNTTQNAFYITEEVSHTFGLSKQFADISGYFVSITTIVYIISTMDFSFERSSRNQIYTKILL